MLMTIRILHLEPNMLDAELAALELKKNGLDCHIDLAQSLELYINKLEDTAYDVVISEFELPFQRTAEDALTLLRQKHPRIPFLIFSKITDELIAAKMLTVGAADYVFKSHAIYLAEALKEALLKSSLSELDANDHDDDDSPFSNSGYAFSDDSVFMTDNETPSKLENVLANNLAALQSRFSAKADGMSDAPALVPLVTPVQKSHEKMVYEQSLEQARSEIEHVQTRAALSELELKRALKKMTSLETALKEALSSAPISGRDEASDQTLQHQYDLAVKTNNELRTQVSSLEAEIATMESDGLQTRQQLQDAKIIESELRAKLADADANFSHALTQAEAQFNMAEVRLTNDLNEAQILDSHVKSSLEQIQDRVSELEKSLAETKKEKEISDAHIAKLQAALNQAQQDLQHPPKNQEPPVYNANLDLTPTALITVNLQGIITTWNQAAAQFHDIKSQAAIGSKSDEIMKYQYASSKDGKAIMKALQLSGIGKGKIRYTSLSGVEKHAMMTISKIFNLDQELQGFLTTLEERISKEAKASHLFDIAISPLLAAGNVALFNFDLRGVLTLAENTRMLKSLAPFVEKSKSVYEVFGTYPSLVEGFRRVMSGESTTVVVSFGADTFFFTFAPAHDEQGKLIGASAAALKS
jgi:PAS domain S-box-containing protein